MESEVCPICCLIHEEDYCPDCNCSQCGTVILDGDYGKCVSCGLQVCESCQQPCSGPPNPMIDYPVHSDCYDS